MEKQILEIIDINYDPDWEELGLEKAAKEITSHVMEFIEWITLHAQRATTYSPMFYLIEKDEVKINEYHINELYQYWLTNIKTK